MSSQPSWSNPLQGYVSTNTAPSNPSETPLQGYVQAAGTAATPQEPSAQTTGAAGLYVAFTFPVMNDPLDPDGNPQPLTPPCEIHHTEIRYTYDDRVSKNWQDNDIVWTKHEQVLTSGPTAKLQNPNLPYDPDTNPWVGLPGKIAIRPVTIKPNIYFQMRWVSRHGVPSQWTNVVKLGMNPNPGIPDSSPCLPCTTINFSPNNLGNII
jgi:hypothetical protein